MNVGTNEFRSFTEFSCDLIEKNFYEALENDDNFAKFASMADQVRDAIGIALDLPEYVV